MIIKVTQEHINKGCVKESSICPIAKAILDSDKNIINVYVHNYSVLIKRKDYSGHNRIELPERVVNFILAFDGGHPVTPFEFELDIN